MLTTFLPKCQVISGNLRVIEESNDKVRKLMIHEGILEKFLTLFVEYKFYPERKICETN